jgi:nicotinamidase/pyrazinamidase
MPVLNEWITAAERAGVPIFVSRDWHPARTTHFKDYGGVWPAHCVMGTRGAEFHPDLHLTSDAIVVSKGMGETEDAYSAFAARDDSNILLGALLKARNVNHLYIAGLATDYCVKNSALDALNSHLGVTLVPEGMRAVNLQPTDGEQALTEMRARGAQLA